MAVFTNFKSRLKENTRLLPAESLSEIGSKKKFSCQNVVFVILLIPVCLCVCCSLCRCKDVSNNRHGRRLQTCVCIIIGRFCVQMNQCCLPACVVSTAIRDSATGTRFRRLSKSAVPHKGVGVVKVSKMNNLIKWTNGESAISSARKERRSMSDMTR